METKLLTDKHYLVCFDVQLDEKFNEELEYVKEHFCGKILTENDDISSLPSNAIISLCGNVSKFQENYGDLFKSDSTRVIRIIQELSFNHQNIEVITVTLGSVPLNMFNVGLFIRDYFWADDAVDYFSEIKNAHQFQVLTESNKETLSFRKGLYLSNVDENKGEVQFNLLRCSTNLDGPTDAFKDVDKQIVDKVNGTAKMFFAEPSPFNHVLAQVYENSVATVGNVSKEKKARIKRHSDKTKDMPRNGLIAFCTFYSEDIHQLSKPGKDDIFDRVYKNGSVLTQLRFKLKDCVENNDSHYEKEFSIKLYPNSVFIISLEMNRLYTHEIVPPCLPVDKIPTRLGYVIRCSKTNAVHKDGHTFIQTDAKLVKLEKPTEADIDELRGLYFKENTTDEVMEYKDIYYSMNEGDYAKPTM